MQNAVPLFSEGQIIGVISVESEEPGQYGEKDMARLQSIADEAVHSLQCVWRQRQLKNQSEQLNALIDVGQNVVSNLEIQNLWDSITEAALDLTGARMSTLQLYDKKLGLVTMKAVRPSSGKVPITREPCESKRVWRCPPFKRESKSVPQHHYPRLSRSFGYAPTGRCRFLPLYSHDLRGGSYRCYQYFHTSSPSLPE